MTFGMLDFPLLLLTRKFQIFQPEDNFKQRFVQVVLLVLILYMEIVQLVQYFYIADDTIEDLVAISEAVAAYSQFLTKFAYCIYNKEKFMNLFKLTKQFWDYKGCTEEIIAEGKTIAKYVIVYLKFFVFFGVFVGELCCVASFIFKRKMGVGTWNLTNYDNLHSLTKVLEFIGLGVTAGFVSAFDNVFIAICFELKIQFKILCDHIQKLNGPSTTDFGSNVEEAEQYKRNIELCIQQHQFLLRYIKLFRDCFSGILLLQFLNSGPLMCCELYAVLEKSSTSMSLRYILGGFAAFDQFSIYCISADLLVQEMDTVSVAIYSSNWYTRNSADVRMPLQFMMQLSQKEFRFLAGSLIDINVKTLFSLFKAAASACTLLRNLNH